MIQRMNNKKFSNWPSYSNKEINDVSQILKNGEVNYLFGNIGENFEKKFSSYVGNKFSIAVSNGTVALELAIKSLNLKKNSEIIVTSRSFVATASSVINCGMKIKFCDVNLNTQNIDVESLKKIISKNTRAIICVHFAGMPCEMDQLMNLIKNKNIYLIEDCSQAHGAKFKGKKIGSFGIISTWSFCRDKIISTGGEGGMISTNSKKLRDIMWSLKDHGKNYNKFRETPKKKSYEFKYIHDNFGSNYRLTEIQSSIGLNQLKLLDRFIQIRNKNAKIYKSIFQNINEIKFTNYSKDYLHSYYKFYFYFIPNKKKYLNARKKILTALNLKGIPITSGGCAEIYKEKCFNKIYNFENAKILSKFSYCLPVDQTINSKNIKIIANQTLKEIKKYL
jgi:dTDP-4-amino-4,6-dideoxygalactose transaminase